MEYQNILVETRGAVGWIQLNRPEALNALSNALVSEVGHAIELFQADDAIGAMVITGNEKAFAAGADIKDMENQEFMDLFLSDFPYNRRDGWDSLNTARKPIIAAVAGFALGGGCEMAMACDFILAADNAVFGQPEVTLGVPPGFGGSQRLPRRVGPGMAAQLLLTGEKVKADEALRIGLCNQVLPAEQLLERGVEMAVAIAKNAPLAVSHCKRLVQVSGDQSIENGCRMESDLFGLSFASEDQKEGMGAFVERRKAEFTGQ